jgi:hypothetical protein
MLKSQSIVVFAEGVIMAMEHPGIAAGSTAVAGIVLLKSNNLTSLGTCWLRGIMLDKFKLFALEFNCFLLSCLLFTNKYATYFRLEGFMHKHL